MEGAMREEAIQVQWRLVPDAAGTASASAPGGKGFAFFSSSRLVAFYDGDASPGLHDVTVIGITGQADRDRARRAIRAAILAELGRLSGLPPGRIVLHADPGEAPYALLGAPERRRCAWLAISHDGELSLAAISLHGAVGIDVTRIVDIPDWQPVARDYLGPGLAAALTPLAPPARAAAFARAWSEREARLKCLGWPLAEWNPEAEPVLQACRCAALALPEGYVGALALPPG
jgi:4'-phosphopantetheinyl transferase